jgi:predicted RNA binding protein YcfA (HicA-like mRNA interferase family)
LPKIPGINHLDAVRALEKSGFAVVRQGKHIVMSNGTRIVYAIEPIPVRKLLELHHTPAMAV